MSNRNNLKKTVIIFLFGIICNQLVAQQQSINLLHDDFDNHWLDLYKWWPFEPWYAYLYKNDMTYPEHWFFDNGVLKIQIVNNSDYSNNSELYSRKPFLYGMFTLECKRPEGEGFWPAFWLFGENNLEVDIFEYKGAPDVLSMNCHYFDKNHVHYSFSRHEHMDKHEPNGITSHKYQLMWAPNALIWLLDGEIIRIVYKYYETFKVYLYKNHHTEENGMIILDGHLNKCDNCEENFMFPTTPMHLVINNGLNKGNLNNATKYHPPYNELSIDYVNVCQIIPETTNICNLNAPDAYGYWPDIVGENVIIGGNGCDIHLQANKTHPDKLNIYATKQIDINEGFEADIGTTVEIGLQIPYCSNNSKGNEFSDSPIDSFELERISKEYQERIDTIDTLFTPLVQLDKPIYSINSNDSINNTNANNSKIPNLNNISHDQILIFPNPTSDYLYVLFDEVIGDNIKIELYNSIGAKVYSKTTNYIDNYRIDLSSFAKGEYLLNILSNKISYTNKIFLK